jgi:hypothetical protein
VCFLSVEINPRELLNSEIEKLTWQATACALEQQGREWRRELTWQGREGGGALDSALASSSPPPILKLQ